MSGDLTKKKKKEDKKRKYLLKILDRFYKKDLEDVCATFYLKKNGSKQELKQRIIEKLDSNKQDIDFDKLRKEIKRVYNSNDKIKKSPKKAKSPKKKRNRAHKPEGRPQSLEPDPDYIQDYYYSSDSDEESPEKTLSYDLNLNQHFQPTVSSEDNSFQPLICQQNVTQTQQTFGQSFSANSVSTSMSFPPIPPRPSDQVQPQAPIFRSLAPIFANMNSSQRNPFAFTSGPSVQQTPTYPPQQSALPQQPNMDNNPVPQPNPQPIFQPLANNPFSGSTQPVNYSINNYFQNSSHSYYQQNYYQNPITDILSATPENIDSFVEQQKFLLSQYPKSFQNCDKSSTESEAKVSEFTFKCLPKYKTFKQLKPIKTIGSLSDIGTEVEFNISIHDLEPNYFEKNYLNFENLKNLLDRKTLKVQLRFGYVTNIKNKEQKDSVPEHLCIECNNKRIFTYEENYENISGPFDLSDVCCYNTNKVRFWMSKSNYTFLLPCIYEISIVEFETSDSLLLKLKQNLLQFLSSESTKQIIRSRNEQSHEDIISINTEFKLKLTCPLSCRRIETPIRSVDCKHIECFDASSFFRTNEKRYDWFCPICQKSAQFDRLRIDGFVAEILYSTESTITEIFIKPDASYDTIQTKMETIIDLGDSSDSELECSVVDSDGCIVLD